MLHKLILLHQWSQTSHWSHKVQNTTHSSNEEAEAQNTEMAELGSKLKSVPFIMILFIEEATRDYKAVIKMQEKPVCLAQTWPTQEAFPQVHTFLL